MPPRTRACKSNKALKENVVAADKGKLKPGTKAKNPARKVLADKTNSASDDNETIQVPKKGVTKAPLLSKVSKPADKNRPRRDRRIPNRFVESQVLINLSNNKENASLTPISRNDKPRTPGKSSDSSVADNSFKTPGKTTDTLLLANRPKRVCRLPSKFEDHLVSPSRFMPVQPVQASTPILQNKVSNFKQIQESKQNNNTPNKTDLVKERSTKKVTSKNVEHSSDSNNIAKQERRALRGRNVAVKTKDNKTQKTIKTVAQNKSTSFNKASPKKAVVSSKIHKAKDFSFRVLETKKQSDNGNKSGLDVYEFTFDPNEEPPPPKKKKKVVKKKPSIPKTVVFKNNYHLNLSKALSVLKSTVSNKSTQKAAADTSADQHNVSVSTTHKDVIIEQPAPPTNGEKNIQKDKHVSIRVEDIAADIQPSMDHGDINYSPVNSPMRPMTAIQPSYGGDSNPAPAHDDPLNLKENLSFFDDQPVASSSMNMSARHPHASPWRVEFENLPIRWHASSYTKANMTPAVECSFINFDDNKSKKHVYTNIVPQAIETLQDLVNSNQPNMKQTSIISFIKEKAELSANRKRGRSKTPIRSNIFDDLTKTTTETNKTPRKVVTPKKVAEKNSLSPRSSSDTENVSPESGKVNRRENLKRKNDSEQNEAPAKTPRKEKDNDNTFFGFDDSVDVENISPNKVVNPKAKSLRPRARAVLKEINKQAGPTRAVVPIASKAKANSEVVSKLYEELKSAETAPVFPEGENVEITNVDGQIDKEINNEDSESVHLFEDIELIHHLKAHRKSYGKPKKVAFRERSISSSETENNVSSSETENNEVPKETFESSDEDDLQDLTFEMPVAKQKRTVSKKKKTKKITKKQKETNKQDQEAEEWAAGFNSMCEEVDEFPLVFD